MAIAVVQKGVDAPAGSEFEATQTVALDTSYPNPAGYVLTPSTFGFTRLKRIKNIEPTSLAAAATWTYWLVPSYDSDGFITSVAFHLAVVATGVEVANAVNVSTATYQFTVEGH